MSDVFEVWAIVELFGHGKIAGKVSEQQVFGTTMLRVDVPAHEGTEAFHRLYSAGALFGITPCPEADVLRFLSYYRPGHVPVHLPGTVVEPAMAALPAGDPHDEDDLDVEEFECVV